MAAAAAVCVCVIVCYWDFTSEAEGDGAKNKNLEEDLSSSVVSSVLPLLRRIYNLYYSSSHLNMNLAEWIQSQKMVFLSHLNMNLQMNSMDGQPWSLENIYAIYQSFLLILYNWTRTVYQLAISSLASRSRRNRNQNHNENMNVKFKSPKSNQ
eukprot:888148_1